MGRSALFTAAENCHEDAARLLLEHKANIDLQKKVIGREGGWTRVGAGNRATS